MHPSALQTGELFFHVYWNSNFKKILDIGSRDVNGTLRDFAPVSSEYIGVDLSDGPGVDRVLSDPYDYPFPSGHFDMIVSTSCYEHDQMFWLTFSESCRVLADGGFIYINTPSSGPYHAYPSDHWRFYADAGLALEAWGRRMNHVVTLVESFQISQSIEPFMDNVMVFTKRDSYVGGNFIHLHMAPAINIRIAGSPLTHREQ